MQNMTVAQKIASKLNGYKEGWRLRFDAEGELVDVWYQGRGDDRPTDERPARYEFRTDSRGMSAKMVQAIMDETDNPPVSSNFDYDNPYIP